MQASALFVTVIELKPAAIPAPGGADIVGSGPGHALGIAAYGNGVAALGMIPNQIAGAVAEISILSLINRAGTNIQDKTIARLISRQVKPGR